MEVMRESWTDERLDDGFARVSADISELRGEIRDLRKEMQQEFRSLQRLLVQLAGGIIVALLGVIATQL